MRLVDGDSAVATGGRQCLSRSRPREARPGYRGWIIEARSTSPGSSRKQPLDDSAGRSRDPVGGLLEIPVGLTHQRRVTPAQRDSPRVVSVHRLAGSPIPQSEGRRASERDLTTPRWQSTRHHRFWPQGPRHNRSRHRRSPNQSGLDPTGADGHRGRPFEFTDWRGSTTNRSLTTTSIRTGPGRSGSRRGR